MNANKKTKIFNLSYNAMFKAVFSNNKAILAKLIEAILEYCKMNIDIKGKEIIIKNNELPISNYKDKQLICDYIIKLIDAYKAIPYYLNTISEFHKLFNNGLLTGYLLSIIGIFTSYSLQRQNANTYEIRKIGEK